ncbi:MAG: hypothetical protein AAGA48_02630 [Myxococcota bacterium]
MLSVLLALTGCFLLPARSIVDDWVLLEVDEFDVEGEALETSIAEGVLFAERRRNAVTGSVSFTTKEFGMLSFDVEGEWDRESRRLFRLDLAGALMQDDYPGFTVQGDWICNVSGDLLLCDGALDSADESYGFELEFGAGAG